MSKIKIISFLWLFFFVSFSLGVYFQYARFWPHSKLREIKQFIEGDTSEDLPIWQKLVNDFDIKPARQLVKFPEIENYQDDKYKQLVGVNFNSRRTPPLIYLSENAPKGYRLIYGAFDFVESLHGAILLDSEGKVVNVWNITQKGLDWEAEPDTNIFPNGVVIAPDGTIVTAYDHGNSLTKYDYSGNVAWSIKGEFHHSIAFEGDDSIWTLWNPGKESGNKRKGMTKIDNSNGEIIRELSFEEIINANPNIDIFGIKQNDTVDGSEWLYDHWHPNDVEPLPKELEQFYPGFKAGDLLVSLRSVNLVFVMDQDTLKVKWWRQGFVRRQHDPDWNDRGTITVFNNNMHREYSSINEVDPSTYESKTVIDGKKYNFYSWMRGKHQMMPDGGYLITSSEQGRVFETDADGNITFEFLNTYGADQECMVVSEGIFLPMDYFKTLPQCNK